MKPLQPLDKWDFNDTVSVQSGYDLETIPDISRDNFNILVKKYNELIEIVNQLLEKDNE